MALFRSDEGLMTRTECLADLLWALEMLARSPDHLLQSALLLARLDSVDPGGKWGNRPGTSLRRILLSWSPQTYAGPEQRLKVVDAVAKRFPQVGWNLLVRPAPRHHDTSDFSPMPDWRDFAPDREEEITLVAVQEAAAAIGRRMLDHVGLDPGRWGQVLDHWAAFDPGWREQAGARLAETVRRLDDPAAIETMRDNIRDLLAKHRGFASTERAMPEADLAPLETAFQGLPPQRVEDRSRWLFRPGNAFLHPNVPWDVLQSEQAACQRDAAAELLTALDPERIYAFAGTITMHHAFGLALAQADAGEAMKEILLEIGLCSPLTAQRSRRGGERYDAGPGPGREALPPGAVRPRCLGRVG